MLREAPSVTVNCTRLIRVDFIAAGDLLSVRVTNQSGHKLPSGYPEGRRMWLNVKFLDANSRVIQEVGAYDAAPAVQMTEIDRHGRVQG